MKGTQEKKAVLGIDFGTTYTFVIKGYGIDSEREQLDYIGGELYENTSKEGGDVIKYSNGIRTVIGYSDEKGWKIGQDAISLKDDIDDKGDWKFPIYFDLKKGLLNIAKELQDDKSNLNNLKDFEKWLSCEGNDEKKEKYGFSFKEGGKKKFFSAIDLAKKFFELLFKHDIFNVFNDIKCVVMGAPSADMGIIDKSTCYNAVILQDILSYIAQEILGLKIDEKDMLIIPEPQLAGKAFIAEEQMPELCDGEQLLVVDIGGGTTDFAVLERKGNQYIAPCASRGDIEIAGNCFDKALETCITMNDPRAEGKHFTVEARRIAKEELFLTKQSSKIQNLAEKNKKTEDEIYKDYLDHGRRSVIKDRDGEKYGVYWKKKHKEGIPHDGYKQDADNHVFDDLQIEYELLFKNLIYDETSEVPRGLAVNLREYVNDIPKDILKWGKLKVLFVGGASQMKELCKLLCEKGLELKQEGNQWYKYKNGEKFKVTCYPDETWVSQDKKESQLTCANMIAIGALLFAEDQLLENKSNAIYSVPTLFIGIPTFENRYLKQMEYHPLISQEMKNGVFTNLYSFTECNGNITKEKEDIFAILSFTYNYDIEKCIHFKILKRVMSPMDQDKHGLIQMPDGNYYMVFPKDNYYYKFHIGNDQEDIVCKTNREYIVYFLADSPQGKEASVFVLLSKRSSEKEQKKNPELIVAGYDYRFPDGINQENCVFAKELNNLYGTRNYCKQYVFHNREDKELIKGKPYSISAKANKDGYGWKIKSSHE